MFPLLTVWGVLVSFAAGPAPRQDPLQGLGALSSSASSKVALKTGSLRRAPPGVGVSHRVTAHILQQGPQQQLLQTSSLDSPLFELLLCEEGRERRGGEGEGRGREREREQKYEDHGGCGSGCGITANN